MDARARLANMPPRAGLAGSLFLALTGGAHLKQKVLLSVQHFGKHDYLLLLMVHTGNTVRFSFFFHLTSAAQERQATI